MNEKKWKRFLKNEMDKELQEIESILEEMDNDPNMKDVVAPEEIHGKLFAQIHEEQNKREALSEEDKELIRLGKIYRKKRKGNKYLVLVAALVCAMALGVTSMGGPERVMQKFGRMVGDREQDYINNDDERTDEIEVVSEADAYQQIEDEFGIFPVKPYYLPQGIVFEEISMDKTMQVIHMTYQGEKDKSMSYTIYLNYRTGSIGTDVEDELISEYDKEVDGNQISIRKYRIAENQTERFVITYEYKNAYYFLQTFYIDVEEIEKIVENLYFN